MNRASHSDDAGDPGATCSRRLGALLVALLLASGCKGATPSELDPGVPAPKAGIRWLRAQESGDVAPLVRTEQKRTGASSRKLLVYVGAVWCEPCQRFHHAAERGELDASFPGLTLLEFDIDRDRERLAAAGYASQFIPLFAVPKEDGTASGKQVEGGIKGDGAVGFITAKVKDLLATP
jgi:hypothetical protein